MKREYPKEVLEIHHAFQVASEHLLSEANKILNSNINPEIEKAMRLRSVGFTQAHGAEPAEWKDILWDEEIKKEDAERVIYYQFNYRDHKFVTEEQVKTICGKYNLICGDIDRYKGFVPEKNLKEIEQFKIKGEDIGKDIWLIGQGNHNHGEAFKEDDPIFKSRNRDGNYRQEERIAPKKICAPVKDMNIRGMDIIDGYKLEHAKPIPDPIVLQPVKGGYLIITAWGDEASDENVVNQNNN